MTWRSELATERVPTEENDVQCEDKATHSDAEAIGKPESFDCIPREHADKHDRDIHEVAVNVLNAQRPRTFADVTFPRFPDGTARWVGPKGFVIGSAVVIGRSSGSRRAPHRINMAGEYGSHVGHHVGSGPKPGVFGIAPNFRRIER